MTDNFEEMINGVVDEAQVSAEEAIRSLKEAHRLHYGPYLDQMIRMAAERRILMLGNGFTTDDVSTMFRLVMEAAIDYMKGPDLDEQLIIQTYLAEEMGDEE